MVWLLGFLIGCASHSACVSDTWVVDADGASVEACVEVARQGLCESVIGHPTFPGPCGDPFPVLVSECPGLTLTEQAHTDLVTLQVVGPTAVGVPACGSNPDTTAGSGDTALATGR